MKTYTFAKKFGMPVEQFRALMESFEQAMEAAYEEEEARDVRNVRLDDLQLKVGKEFLYLFDYGDELALQGEGSRD